MTWECDSVFRVSTSRAWSSEFELCVVMYAFGPRIQEAEQKIQKDILGYKESSGPAWDTWSSSHKQTNKTP